MQRRYTGVMKVSGYTLPIQMIARFADTVPGSMSVEETTVRTVGQDYGTAVESSYRYISQSDRVVLIIAQE